MTYERLAEIVADDFKKTMKDEGFETFKEMCYCYGYDSQDIKEEVDSIIREIAGEYYIKYHDDFYMYDDLSAVQIGLQDEMSWKDFKKLMLSHLK